MKKLKDLELRKLILELELLEMDEKYNLEFVDNYRPLFNEHLRKVSPDFKEPTPTPPPTEGEEPTPPQETPVFQVDEEELKKIKKIYKEISKICHPDKTSDINLNEMYIQAKLLYEKNDLLGLITVAQKLSLNFEIEENDVSILKRTLADKKSKLLKIEGTFLWLWANSSTEEEKESIIKMYVEQFK
jgi:hypothetical protein